MQALYIGEPSTWVASCVLEANDIIGFLCLASHGVGFLCWEALDLIAFLHHGTRWTWEDFIVSEAIDILGILYLGGHRHGWISVF